MRKMKYDLTHLDDINVALFLYIKIKSKCTLNVVKFKYMGTILY